MVNKALLVWMSDSVNLSKKTISALGSNGIILRLLFMLTGSW